VRRALLLVGVCVLGGGCVPLLHFTTRPAPRARVVPSFDHTRGCRASDLGHGVVFMQGATGQMIGGVRVRDTSARACTLTGFPTLTLIAHGGTEIPARRERAGSVVGQPRWPGYPLVLLRPGQDAFVPFIWDEYCGRARLGAVRLAWRGWAVTVPARGAPECNPPPSRSSLAVGRFQPAG
jgi:hypothetical protein